MVASKFGFCWADEVEKEEEEEEERGFRHRRRERSRSRSPEKPNPFGSARPREVVLQEKGIDWRKLDSTPRKEKHLPENVPASTGSSGGRKQWSPRSRDLEPNVENARRTWARESGISSSSLTFPSQNVDSLVPPLRYPPKNIAILMKGKQWPENAHERDVSLSNSKELHVEKQRENVIPESGVQLDSSFRDQHHNRYSVLHNRELDLDKKNPHTESRDSFTVKEFGYRAQGEIRRERSPLVHREKEWKEMNHHSSERHFLDERLPAEERRGAHNESWDDGGYEYGRTSGARERFRRSPSIDQLSNRETLRYRPYNKEAAFRGNYRNVGARPSEERGNGNMDYFSGRQRFDAEYEGPHKGKMEERGNGNMDYFSGRQRFDAEYEGPRTGRMDRGRAENHRDMNMDKAGFRRNDRNSIGGNYGNVGARPLDETHTEKMDMYGRQRFDGKDLDASRTRSMERRRSEYHPDRGGTNRVDFGSNYKSRDVESRPNTSHDFQRRGRGRGR